MIATLAALATSIVVAVTVTANALGGSTQIDWKTCGDKPGAECATVTVPINWEDPESPTMDLNVTRRAATNPDKRVGPLFYNPGGPGTEAASLVRDYPEQKFSERLRERFDIIGIDPRGVAGSQQISCDKSVYDPEVSQFPDERAEYERLHEHNRAVADSCDDLIGHIGTDSVARDFDAVRAALGENKISYLGQSYGSVIGTEYAQHYPDRVRALSLDGVMDHSLSAERMVRDACTAVENSFQDFTKWCEESTDCALHSGNVTDVWDKLAEKAESEPLPVKDGGRPVTSEELRYSAYAMLNMMPEIGKGLSEAIAEADAGDASGFAAIRQEAMDNPATTAPYRGVLCMDVDPQIDDEAALSERADEARKLSPHMRGTSEFWHMTAGCLGWPIAPSNPQSDIDIDGISPSLLVGSTGDPATPVDWAKSLSRDIADSQVLTVESAGHTAYARSKCATKKIDEYLIDGKLPAVEETCE